MPEITANDTDTMFKRHSKDARHGLARFRQAIGSLPSQGLRPPKNFVDEGAAQRLTERARD